MSNTRSAFRGNPREKPKEVTDSVGPSAAAPKSRLTSRCSSSAFIAVVSTSRLAQAFNGFIEGFLGFLLLPFTTLFFALCYSVADGGVTGFGWLIVAFGLALDISNYANGAKANRDRNANA